MNPLRTLLPAAFVLVGIASTASAQAPAAPDQPLPAGTSEVVQPVMDRMIFVHGILDQFDCPSMLRLMAPRALLIPNGEKDANCPIEGARLAFAAAEKAYKDAGASERLRIMVANVGHTVTPEQRQAALAWFEKWLK